MITAYHTQNSVYLVDHDGYRYMRIMKTTSVKNVPSPRLEYGEWLPLKKFDDARQPVWMEDGCLRILHETSTWGIYTSPIQEIAFDVDEADFQYTHPSEADKSW